MLTLIVTPERTERKVLFLPCMSVREAIDVAIAQGPLNNKEQAVLVRNLISFNFSPLPGDGCVEIIGEV